MYLSTNSRAASTYRRVAVSSMAESASPHALIEMLFDGLLSSLSMATLALQKNDVSAKGKALSKAIRLLSEGLKGGLSTQGGDLSSNLGALYDYCIIRLTEANLNNDSAAIQEVRGLIQTIAGSWKAISPENNQAQ